jgi:hypothetical protein
VVRLQFLLPILTNKVNLVATRGTFAKLVIFLPENSK